MSQFQLFFYSFLSQVIFLSACGFLLGIMIVLDSAKKPSRGLIIGIGFLFMTAVFAAAYSAPGFALALFHIQGYFIVVFPILLTHFYMNYLKREKNNPGKLVTYLLTFLGMLSVVTIVYFFAAFLGYVFSGI